MDLMVLDKDLDAISVIDTYESFIWTDRYYQYGDFELYTAMTDDLLNYIQQDYYLQKRGSDRVMIIEKLLIETDAEDGNHITVTGRSLESILDRRVIWGLITITGNLQDGIETLLNACIIKPSNVNRQIPNFVFKRSTDPAITKLTIEAQYTGDNLYDVIQKICEERGIGFKITLNNSKQFVFELYSGVDRSYDQTVNPYVVFSPSFDNIVSSNYVESKSALKNVTLVGGEGEGSARRYTAVGNVSGLDRRETFTDARDISSDIDEDLASNFTFTQYPSQVFNVNSKTFVTDALFNSCMVDVSAHAGQTISISIPMYTNSNKAAPPYATILVNSAKQYISTLQAWEKYDDTANRGVLGIYELRLPEDAAYIYTSMYSQKAIDDDVFYGDADDFQCEAIQMSNTEYVALLRQRGKETLSENTDVISFEGEMETSIMYKYGEDFFSGDIVQIMNEYGHNAKVRILEVITSENQEGASVYPTFSIIEPESLPSGYLRLQYIESNGTQYINTGVSAPNGFKVDVSILYTKFTEGSSGYSALIGCINDSSPYSRNYLATLGKSGWELGCGDGIYDGGVTEVNVRYSVSASTVHNNRYVIVNGVEQVLSGGSTKDRSSKELYLLAINYNQNPSYAHARLYSCKIYKDDTLVRNFIPCKNESDVVGLYDIVEKKFYGNSGTGSFIAG